MRVGYWRVSTSTDEQLAAAENQRQRLEAAGVDRLLGDVGSGLDLQRPGYLELLELIDRRLVDEVLLTRLDRLCRDAAASDAVLVIAARRGVTIRALDGGTVDAVSPHGFLLSRIATSLAEVESRQLSLRVRRGLEAGRAQKRPIRGRAPWGYQLKPDRSGYVLDPVAAPQARALLAHLRANDWRLYPGVLWEGSPFRHITGLRCWLLNPVLRGGLGYHRTHKTGPFKEIHWDCHEALLTHAQYDEIQRTMELNRSRWGNNAAAVPSLLAGLVVCGDCGHSCSRTGRHTRMICRYTGCGHRYTGCRIDKIKAAIFAELSAAADRLPTSTGDNPEVRQLREQIAQLESLADPDLETALARKRERLRHLQQSRPEDTERLELLRNPGVWACATEEELRTLFVVLVAEVVVLEGEVQRVRLRL